MPHISRSKGCRVDVEFFGSQRNGKLNKIQIYSKNIFPTLMSLFFGTVYLPPYLVRRIWNVCGTGCDDNFSASGIFLLKIAEIYSSI